MSIPDDLTPDDLAVFHALGPDHYVAAVCSLFMSGRATPELWSVMARAILHVSESSNSHLVRAIDRAILCHHAATQRPQEVSHADSRE
jgi:hypothetical protein